MKSGFPISWWTFAEIAQIPNFGPAPMDKEGKPVQNEMEKWIAQKHIERELAEELGAATEGRQVPSAAGPPTPPGPPGRPPANTGEARIQQKDGGTRSTITTTE
jgi:hypothetical protein